MIASRGGIATRSQILHAGVTAPQLSAAVLSGSVTRIRRGHYAIPSANPDAIIAVHVGGALCGPSAARSFGLWGGFDERLHVALPANASRSRVRVDEHVLLSLRGSREVVRHWTTRTETWQCWRVDIFTCLIQCVSWCDEETALAVLDTARTRHRLTMSTLRRVFEAEPARSRLLLSRSRPGSDSGLESIVRQRLTALRYRVVQQVRLPGVGRIDLHIVGTGVFIEIDGREHHADALAFARDRRRDANAARSGAVVLRFTYEQVISDWAWCEQSIRSAALRFQDDPWLELHPEARGATRA